MNPSTLIYTLLRNILYCAYLMFNMSVCVRTSILVRSSWFFLFKSMITELRKFTWGVAHKTRDRFLKFCLLILLEFQAKTELIPWTLWQLRSPGAIVKEFMGLIQFWLEIRAKWASKISKKDHVFYEWTLAVMSPCFGLSHYQRSKT